MKVGILLSDIQLRKSFDVFNIIKKEFSWIKVFPCTPRPDLILRMSYGNIFLLRTKNFELFENDLNELIRVNKDFNFVYLPLEEDTTVHFLNYIKKTRSKYFYILPNINTFNLVRNKFGLNEYCQENGIGCPKLFLTIKEIENINYPLIIKPRFGSGSNGIYRFDNGSLLKDYIQINSLDIENYVIQELLPDGKNVLGAFFLCVDGNIISYYSHQRIRTIPADGGVTVLSKVDLNSEIKQEGKKLLELLKWNGLIMIEFLYDSRDGKYKIIEINPRIWGSILLSEFSGANLLKNYISICLGLKLNESTINLNAKIRWFFPTDIIGYIKSGFTTKKFWEFEKDTCYINISYSKFIRSFMFFVVSFLNFNNLKKIIR